LKELDIGIAAFECLKEIKNFVAAAVVAVDSL
jgi:hypothetical protein